MAPDLRFRAFLAVVAALALAVRAYDLGGPSVWFDEALEIERAAGSLGAALTGRPIDQDPPLLALLYHFWQRLRADEFWLRAPSALAGAGAVVLAGHWARLNVGRAAGGLTALMVALAPVQVHYGREVNQYAAVVLLSLVAFLAWERVISVGSRRDWLVYSIVSVLALATHYCLAFPLCAMGAYLAYRVLRQGDAQQRRWLAVYVAVAGATVAALVVLGLPAQLSTPHLQRRFGGTHVQKELDYVLDRFWREVLVFFLFPFSGGPVLWAVVGLAIAAVIGAESMWRLGGAARRVVGVIFIGTLACIYPADGFGVFPMGNRYVLFLAAPLYVAIAAGFVTAWRRARIPATVAALTTLALFLLFMPHASRVNSWLTVPREELRPVLDEFDRRRSAADGVYVYYGALPAFDYYRPSFAADVSRGRHLGDVGIDSEAERIVRLAQHSPVWLVFAHGHAGEVPALLGSTVRRGLAVTDAVAEANAGAFRLSSVDSGP